MCCWTISSAKLRIKPERIKGYEREETTHMAVAVAIASGLMDTGLGVKSAAKALGLDFVPIEREEYDLVFQKAFFNSDTGSAARSPLSAPPLSNARSNNWTATIQPRRARIKK